MCGIIAIRGEGHVVHDLYNGLISIQHRGQDAAGMVTFDDRFHLKKGFGLVSDIFGLKHMRRLTGQLGLGHVRYPTVGQGKGRDAQPFLVNAPYGIALAHNGNVTNFRELKAELFRDNRRHVNSDCDAEVILNVLADELDKGVVTRADRAFKAEDLFRAVRGVFTRVKGAYSVVALVAGHGILAFRDPHGIRPCILGERRSAGGRVEHCVASESVTLDLLGFQGARDLRPGEAVFLDAMGGMVSRQVAPGDPRPCIFEQVYFARPDSVIDGISVYKTRTRMGSSLARAWKQTGIEVDVIIPVPESARPAATAMATELGVKYSEGLVKNRYIGRTFIMPGRLQREQNIRRKLNAIRFEFEDKRVLLVDDSIVRGSTSRQIVRLAREAGARQVYFLSYSAPIRFPCYYGIDMQTRKEFIAADHTLEEIAAEIGADRVFYQEVDAMVDAARAGNREIRAFCTACFTGDYPAGELSEAERQAVEAERAAILEQ
ncbi:MAG: amidophosphoribosyltransferase [Planctomycetes bacterium]|nr:amidophosphoribosyltransferase [Planctomycetota bacterium]